MGNSQRKARKRAGVKFERTQKTPTGTYVSKDDERKKRQEFRRNLDLAMRRAAAGVRLDAAGK